MGGLRSDQRDSLREYLYHSGLTFNPLLDEMVDHLGCELEERMEHGLSFEEAWQQSLSEVPHNHFQLLQHETMESISKRMNLSRTISYVALALLFGSTIFKILHLQFAGELLIVSFFSIVLALVLNAVSGIRLHREKKGAPQVVALVGAVAFITAGYSMKVFHVRGGDFLIVVATLVFVASVFWNAASLLSTSRKENLLSYLHEKYTPGIERFLLILLIPLALYKGVSILDPSIQFTANIILLVVIFGAGLQFIALNWRTIENNEGPGKTTLTALVTVSAVCFILPFLGTLVPFQMRVLVIMAFSLVTGILSLKTDGDTNRAIALPIAIVIPLIFGAWGLVRLSVIPSSAGSIVFNLPVLIVLIAGIFITARHSTMRTYLIISLASYMFEYIA